MTERPPEHAAGAPRPVRHTDRAPIPRTVDRPTPAPIPIVLDRAPRPRAHRRKPPTRPRRWARAVRRGLGTRRGKWLLVALACLLVLLVGLLSQGFLSSPAPKAAPPAAAGSSAPAGPAASTPPASPSPTVRKSATGTISAGDQAVLRTLRDRFPDNPLNQLRGGQIHQVTIEARSAGSFPVLGWLVPTGLGNTYGTQHNANGTWTLSQRAIGKGYLAAVFLQAGRAGVPVTCRVIVDGRVTDSETTSGSYGRTVCLG